jgi:acetyl/propionyl-CoA carboxylase alpha subunit
MERVLIANRSEIALRVLRACRELDLATIAVYSDADADALHVREADDAVRIGTPKAQDSYLNIRRIIDAARETRADAIHPGYGFLSENARFASACEDAGIAFVGPPASAIAAMGDKAAAAESGSSRTPASSRRRSGRRPARRRPRSAIPHFTSRSCSRTPGTSRSS